MSKIAVLYSLARSGGTLVSRCLGSIAGNVLLSEVNPRHAFFNPLEQALQWFNLISFRDIQDLKDTGKYDYLSSIRLIHRRCNEQGMHLIIRDWTHVDFTPGPYPVKPVLRLSQLETLQTEFDVRHIALTRHPLDTYLSLARLQDYRGRLGIKQYLYGARAYAEAATDIGYMRYEDFCRSPDISLKTICDRLDVNYDPEYRDRFYRYWTITGDSYHPGNTITLTGEPVGERTSDVIRLPERRPEFYSLLRVLENNSDYLSILETLNYEY